MTAFLLSAAAAISCLSPSTEAYYIFDDTVVTFDINTGDGLTKISPYIYGIADADELEGVTVNAVKQSSTALSTYNWETNYANSGAQANNSNDNSLISSYPASRWNEPALYSFDLFNKSLQNGVSSRFVTLPMLGYAAGDGSGAVLAPISAEPQHWINVASQKNDVLSECVILFMKFPSSMSRCRRPTARTRSISSDRCSGSADAIDGSIFIISSTSLVNCRTIIPK